MSRRVAREVAMKIAFSKMLGGDATYDAVVEQSDIEETVTEADITYAESVVEGVSSHLDEIDDIISQYTSKNWRIERLPKVELTILRIAIYEIVYQADSPMAAIINAAVELAKIYGDEKSYSYINGILGSFVRSFTPSAD